MTPEERRKLQEWAEQEKTAETHPGREKESWYEDLGEGVVSSGLNTFYGIKDIFTDLTEDEKLMMMDWEEDAGESGWGTAGRVLGEVAQLAVPAGTAVKGVRGAGLLGKALKGRKAAPIVTDIAASAAHGGAQYAEPDESRLMNALSSGGAAAGGGLLGKALRPLTGRSMIKTTEAAEKLMDRGIYLTPGQAATSPAIQGAEAVMEVTPFVARGTKAARQRGQTEWSAEAIKEIMPERLAGKVTEIGHKGLQQASKAIDNGYDEAWGAVKNLPSLRLPDGALLRLTKKDRRVVKNVMDDIRTLRGAGGDVSARQVDKIIRDAMPTKASKRELRGALDDLRKGYRSYLPEEQQVKLTEMDQAWGRFLTGRRAGKLASPERGEFTPTKLIQAANAVGKDAKAGLGQAPLQEMGILGMETVGRKVGGQPLEWFRRVAGISPTPAPMQSIGKTILGRGHIGPESWGVSQRNLADALRRPTEAVSPYISPARYAAAYEETE